jgi:isopropylmalate/homocitrate/citramalate synthase
MDPDDKKLGPWVDDDFWVSPYNFDPDVANRPDMPAKIMILDSTLRDGEQTPGVVFRKEEKIAIAKALDEIGVDRIEAGMPAISPEDTETIRAIAQLGLKAEIYCLCRGMKGDIDLALSCGLKGVFIEVPTGLPRLKYQYANWSETEAIKRSVEAISYAKEKGLRVTFFLMDSSRADKGFLERLLANVVKNSPPDGVSVVDTSGCFLPQASAALVRLVKDITGLPVEIHGHNDMGLGLANTLAALEAGAEVAHVCVNGLGERGGNVALDELAMALRCLYGRQTNIRYTRLTELSQLVEKLSDIPVGSKKPVIGEGIYCRESGLGINLVKQEPLALFAMMPDAVGQSSRIVLGKKSGIASIDCKLEELGIGGLTDEAKRRAVLANVKQLSIEKKSIVTDAEFREIVTRAKREG